MKSEDFTKFSIKELMKFADEFDSYEKRLMKAFYDADPGQAQTIKKEITRCKNHSSDCKKEIIRRSGQIFQKTEDEPTESITQTDLN